MRNRLGRVLTSYLERLCDLYTRWLSHSTWSQQAAVIREQNKKDLVGNVGKVVGRLFEKLSKLGPKSMEAVGGLVKEAFDGLAGANRELLTGGIEFPRLQIEQGRALLALVSQITNRPMVLVMDQWEKSPALALEANVLDAFVRHAEEWPPCHIFVGLRPEEVALKAIIDLHEMAPGTVEIYDLPPMHLDDGTICDALVEHIRGRVPGAANVPGKDLIEIVAGYPGVVSRLTDSYNANRVKSGGLKALADDANNYRYPEFSYLVPILSDEERQLALRLVLLPSTGGEDNWKALRDAVLEHSHARYLDALGRKRLLETSTPPSYGHVKRREAALCYFQDNCKEELRVECESLVFSLACRIRTGSSLEIPFGDALLSLWPAVYEFELSDLPKALCAVARRLFRFGVFNPDLLAGAVEIVSREKRHASIAPMLSCGLYDMFYDAWNHVYDSNSEEAIERRNAVLAELRQLACSYPDDGAVREHLACVIAADASDRLDELRVLARSYPGDLVIGKALASCLYFELLDANREKTLERRDVLLNELRELVHSHPDDGDVRDALAMGLCNTLKAASQEGTPGWREALLDELRELARGTPNDTNVRATLAIGLLETLTNNLSQDATQRRDTLLDELQLARGYPEDVFVRNELADALLKAMTAAWEEGAVAWRGALLDQLRQLASRDRNDAAMRQYLAHGLFIALYHCNREDALERQSLLDQLRHLVSSHPDDAELREDLESWSMNFRARAAVEQGLGRPDPLEDEVFRLADSYRSEAAALRERDAAGNFDPLAQTNPEAIHSRRAALRDELGQLASSYPDSTRDAAVFHVLDMKLASTWGDSTDVEAGRNRRREFLTDLRNLVEAHPGDTNALAIFRFLQEVSADEPD